jgi:hypothetical protein
MLLKKFKIASCSRRRKLLFLRVIPGRPHAADLQTQPLSHNR